MVERVTYLGFEVRVELALTGGGTVWAQVTRSEAEQLELQQGQIVWARPRHAKVFENGGGPQTAELTSVVLRTRATAIAGRVAAAASGAPRPPGGPRPGR